MVPGRPRRQAGCFARFFTICQIRVVVSFVPRLDKKISLLVRRFTSTDPPDQTATEIAHQLIPSYWVRPHRALGTTAGSHRWVWDLRGPRPLASALRLAALAAAKSRT